MEQKHTGYFCVVGSREWNSFGPVKKVVSQILAEGYGVGSGGALGADMIALVSLVQAGEAACGKSIIRLPSSLEATTQGVRTWLEKFQGLGGLVVQGDADNTDRKSYIGGLFARTRTLVAGSLGVVGFLKGDSRGTWYTAQKAVSLGKPVILFSENNGRDLQNLGIGYWVAVPWWPGAWHWAPDHSRFSNCRHGLPADFCGECNQFYPEKFSPDEEPFHRELSDLGKIFDHSAFGGEYLEAKMAHADAMSQADRMLFQEFTPNGDKILIEHENTGLRLETEDGFSKGIDIPSYLSMQALSSRFPAISFADLHVFQSNLLEMEASKEICFHYFEQVIDRTWSEVSAEVAFFAEELRKIGAPESDFLLLEEEDELAEIADEEEMGIWASIDKDGFPGDEEEDFLSCPAPIGFHPIGSIYIEPGFRYEGKYFEDRKALSTHFSDLGYNAPSSLAEIFDSAKDAEPEWLDSQSSLVQSKFWQIKNCKSFAECGIIGAELFSSSSMFSNIQKSVLFSAHMAKKKELTPLYLSHAAERTLDIISAAAPEKLGYIGKCLYDLQKGIPANAKIPNRSEFSKLWNFLNFRKSSPSSSLGFVPDRSSSTIPAHIISKPFSSTFPPILVSPVIPEAPPVPRTPKANFIALRFFPLVVGFSSSIFRPGEKFGRRLLTNS